MAHVVVADLYSGPFEKHSLRPDEDEDSAVRHHLDPWIQEGDIVRQTFVGLGTIWTIYNEFGQETDIFAYIRG